MNETLAARVARALYGDPPPKTGLLCEESVRHGSSYRPCGRAAASFVDWADSEPGMERAYCKLHTTVALRSTGYRVVGPVTEDDHRSYDDGRLIAWVARGQRAVDLLADAGLAVNGTSGGETPFACQNDEESGKQG